MRWGRLAAANHRGALLPRTLGFALAVAATAATLVVATMRDVGSAGWGALAGCILVFAAGLVDDLVPAGPRGLRNHLRSLAAGRMTTGILKLVVAIGAAVVVVALQPSRSGSARLSAVVLLAACANVWNGLDVRPGRALKAFTLPGVAFLVWGELAHAPAIAGVLAGVVVALPADLRERAMLGDGGSNLLGFAAGLALADVLSDAWMPTAAAIAVVLNVVADTVSFSRVIEATPPLRFLDGLGRRP
jgi:UDP-N-acetylmuramyl pentapeptide phosphotransferase/UDP-N-acetylglucosamine-1-phosphate transferase